MTAAASDLTRVPMQLVRGCLVASVQVELTQDVLHRFQQDLLQAVRDTRARAVILDLSGVSILDSSDFESSIRTLRMARLMSATPVIVGLRPGIAVSLVELGASAGDIDTCMSLEQALELIHSYTTIDVPAKPPPTPSESRPVPGPSRHAPRDPPPVDRPSQNTPNPPPWSTA